MKVSLAHFNGGMLIIANSHVLKSCNVNHHEFLELSGPSTKATAKISQKPCGNTAISANGWWEMAPAAEQIDCFSALYSICVFL